MWKHWSIRELQDEIGNKNLDFLEKIIPNLSNNETLNNFIGSKTRLAALVETLKDHNYFRSRANLKKCLFRLPQDEMLKLRRNLGIEGNNNDMDSVCKKILSNNDKYKTFIETFNLDKRFLSSDKIKLEPFFDNHSASLENPKVITKPFKNLKDYQVNCFSNAAHMLEPQMSRAILQMPTGSGKTRTASEIISAHLNERGIKQVVWLANTRELCEQAIQCMKEVWDHIGYRDCRFNRIWDGNFLRIPEWTDIDCVFSVLSLQSSWSLLKSDPDQFYQTFQKTSLVVVDEAHIAVAATYSEVIRTISRTSQCKVLGLTATPGRTIDKETSILSDLFFGNICSLSDPDKKRKNTIAYLRSLGVMSDAFHQEISYSSGLKLTPSEKLNLLDGEDYSERVLNDLGQDAYRTLIIIEKLENLLKQGAKIIMFAPSVQNSFLTSTILTFLGYKSVHVSGDTPPRTRDTLIEKFLSNQYQIMCNYGVLATGFDAPNVDVVCIARPTLSPVLYSQMIGRGLRGPAVGGTDQCLILEVRDNFIGQENQDGLYKTFAEYWS